MAEERLPPSAGSGPLAPSEFRLLADNLPILCWIAQGDGSIVWYNRRWHDHCGTTPAEMEGWGWQKVHDPARLPEVMERWQASIASGAPFEMTFPLRGADGVFRPFLTRVEPYRGEDGAVVRWYGTNTEISAQVALEEDARRSAALLEAVGASSPSLIYAKDRETRMIYANPATAAVFERPVEELIGKTAIDMAGPEGARHVENDLRIIESGAVEEMDETLTTPDGVERVYRSTKAPLRDAAGAIIGMVGVSIEVTERRRIEAALRASESRLRLAMEAGRMAVWSYDAVRDRIDSSPELSQLLGYPADAVLDIEELRARYYPGELERLRGFAQAALAEGERFFEAEYRAYRPDGNLRWYLMRAEFELDAAGAPLRVTGVVLDITGRKAAEEALAEREAELKAALDAGQLAVIDYDHMTGEVRASERMNELYGYPPGHRLTIEDIRARYHPDSAAEIYRKRDEDAAASDTNFDWTLRLRMPDGSPRWLQGLGEYIRDAGGRIVRSRGIVMDVTERKRWEEHQRLLVNELNHRVKNTLAVVQALAWQTFRGAADTGAAQSAFEARLAALSAAHDLLTRQNWEAASLSEIVAASAGHVDAYRGRILVSGPPVEIAPKPAVSIAMALHELSTNAIKYGALSNAHGRVEIDWTLAEAGDRLRLTWREKDGPETRAPARKGFGLRMIERGLAAELGGDVRLDFAPTGLVCTIDAPL
jgi:PAS domain S-box-containing protein